jgi:hypothetical protein
MAIVHSNPKWEKENESFLFHFGDGRIFAINPISGSQSAYRLTLSKDGVELKTDQFSDPVLDSMLSDQQFNSEMIMYRIIFHLEPTEYCSALRADLGSMMNWLFDASSGDYFALEGVRSGWQSVKSCFYVACERDLPTGELQDLWIQVRRELRKREPFLEWENDLAGRLRQEREHGETSTIK